jgi:hypothetical protein
MLSKPQFLLRPDGSIPPGVDVLVLRANGVLLVVPTEAPRQSGMVAVEQDAEQGDDGVWRQSWTLEPRPSEDEPEAASLP